MTDMIYRLVLKAQFENQQELDRAMQNLQKLQIQGAQVNVKLGEMGRQGTLGLNQIARSALSVGYAFNMLESAYMRSTMAQIMMTNAQERLNNAIEKYGANSEEARKATQQLTQQQRYLDTANMRTNISMGLMLTQLALQSKLLDVATLSQIKNTVVTVIATAKEWLYIAALKVRAILQAILTPWMVPVMLATGAAMAGAISAITISAMTAQPPKTEINIQTEIGLETNIDEALAEQNRQVKQELRSFSSD